MRFFVEFFLVCVLFSLLSLPTQGAVTQAVEVETEFFDSSFCELETIRGDMCEPNCSGVCYSLAVKTDADGGLNP